MKRPALKFHPLFKLLRLLQALQILQNRQVLQPRQPRLFRRICRSALLLAFVCFARPAAAQGYEFEREMPRFLDRIKEELDYPMAWGRSPVRRFDRWRRLARQCVFDAMQAPPRRSEAWQAEVVAEERREGYTARRVAFNLTAYSRVEAYLLLPDRPGPHPAVVLLHDHGGHFTIGKEKMIRPFAVPDERLADADAWAAGGYGGRYVGDFLAARGYAVIAVDALFWGDRGRKEGADGNRYADVAGNMMMLGRSLSAFMQWEDLYTTEFLASLPEIDPARIGCMGWSMGGYRAWMLAALTDRIAAGAAVCWMNTTGVQFSWEYGRERGGFANMLPGLRRWLDYPHIASIACPKPMLFINGRRDRLFPATGVEEAFRQMHAVWDDRGVGDRLETELWDMPHDCGLQVQDRLLEFFDKTLRQPQAPRTTPLHRARKHEGAKAKGKNR